MYHLALDLDQEQRKRLRQMALDRNLTVKAFVEHLIIHALNRREVSALDKAKQE